MDIAIRPYLSQDHDACEKIAQQIQHSFDHGWDACLVAVESSSQRVLAFCCWRQGSRRRSGWRLRRIVVDQSCQRRGIARRLLQGVTEQLPPEFTLDNEFPACWDRSQVVSALMENCGIPFRRETGPGLVRYHWTKPAAVPPVASPEGISSDGCGSGSP